MRGLVLFPVGASLQGYQCLHVLWDCKSIFRRSCVITASMRRSRRCRQRRESRRAHDPVLRVDSAPRGHFSVKQALIMLAQLITDLMHVDLPVAHRRAHEQATNKQCKSVCIGHKQFALATNRHFRSGFGLGRGYKCTQLTSGNRDHATCRL